MKTENGKMNRTIISFAVLAATFLCVSCNRENIGADRQLKTITSIRASLDESPLTRAHLEGTDKMKWDQWDNIGVFSDTDNPVPFSTDGGNVFTNYSGQSVSGHEFYAFYPYSEYTFRPDNRKLLYFYLLSGTTGKNPRLNIPMVAKSDGSSFVFKHTCGIIHFSVTGSKTLSSVELKSNAGEKITGTTVNLDDETPVLSGELGLSISYLSLGGTTLSKDEPLDIWFFVPPVTLSAGFTLRFEYEGGAVEKSTFKPVTISRGNITHYSVVDLEQLIEEGESALVKERDALIALYNAMDGDHWLNNTNWCSDKPLSEWYGVGTEPESNRVDRLDLSQNGLNGSLPAEITNLKKLRTLRIDEVKGFISNLDLIFELSSLEELSFGIGAQWDDGAYNGATYDHLIQSHMMTVPAAIGKLKNLKTLYVSGINADLPEELFELENLETLLISSLNTGRPLQVGFGKLKNLRFLHITSLWEGKVPGLVPVNGNLPDDIFELTQLENLRIAYTNIGGELSPRIGDLQKLYYLSLANNQFSGSLPPELTHLKLIENGASSYAPSLVILQSNHFSGKIPEEFRYWPEWQKCWGYIVRGNDLLFTDFMSSISIPAFDVTTLNGERIDSGIVGEHKLTMLFQFTTWCPYSPMIYAELKEIYPAYKDKGLAVISYSDENESILRPFVESKGFTWPTFSNTRDENGRLPLGQDNYPVNVIPCVTIFDQSGTLVYYQIGGEGTWKEFVMNSLGESGIDLYESTDYSADGMVHTLQTATSGSGIDIVLMGDGYSDRLIADGTYASVMQRATEAFFSEEPYKSFRDCFNVHYVDVVSKNERYDAETALSTWYGSGTIVGGDDVKVFQYAQKAISEANVHDVAVIVLMNRDYYAGTCYMYIPYDDDFGRGATIAYFPDSSEDSIFSGMVLHEAGGHGFGKLADEYYYSSYGTIPQSQIDEYRAAEPYGYWKNCDFTSDPSAVKWSSFLADDRYVSEGLGVFEGACHYIYGAWRPTRNSIMNNNTGGFDAPSRYAIWYRIGKLAYGAGWNGTYEDFVAWDAINRTPAAHARRKAKQQNYVEKDFQPLAPPVVIHHSWRDLKR